MSIGSAVQKILCAVIVGYSALLSWSQEPLVPTAGTSAESASSASAPLPAILTQMATKPPKVACSGNQLTISADNSTILSVLEAVHLCTGVRIEIPEGSSDSRTYEELGPGPAREVLDLLLRGTEFDYLIGSSMADSEKIETVVLTLRGKDGSAASAASQDPGLGHRRVQTRESNQQGTRPSDAGRMLTSVAPNPSLIEEEAAPLGENTAGDVAQAAAPAPAESVIVPPANSSAAPSDAAQNPDPAKAMDDRITSMQQLFEQRRQMTGNQPSTPK